MNTIAEQYVKLVLALGLHDEDYVDAYHGPKEWRADAERERRSLDRIEREALRAREGLMTISMPNEEPDALRYKYLEAQLSALIARTAMLKGTRLSFDEESKALYDAVAPRFSEEHFQAILKELESLLPGAGSLNDRYLAFKNHFIIQKDDLDVVFGTAIGECRDRTKKHIRLPEHEMFTVEYVTNKAWSGYNWFKGDCKSLIQVNTDLPIYIDRAIDLAAHEGYPGHHVYNSLLEHSLLVKKGWQEFSVYALFSPQSLIAEGTANYGIDVVFSKEDRIAFEHDILFNLAKLHAQREAAARYYKIHEVFSKLSYAGNEAARGYLDGTMSRAQAIEWLMQYALMARDRAEQRLKFFEKYRSYVINYNVGQDLVKTYIEQTRNAGTDVQKRWSEFAELISSPRLPSQLV
ncbi:MAG TPA: hypothetical protein VK470_16605 [Bacteroidota bacterium]|nr:hypothetical protein [Bacteroidota bacterium]